MATQNSSNGGSRKGKDSLVKFTLPILFGLCIAALFIFFAFNRTSQSNLRINIGGQLIDLGVTNNEIEISDLIDKLFESDASSIQTRALLREFHNLYYIDDPNLINLIETIDEKSFLSQKLRELLDELKGPFRRDLHTFYNIQDKEIAEAIEHLGYNHPVSKALRKLLIFRKGPFAPQEKDIEITSSADQVILKGFAASSRESEFFRKNIRIFNSTKRSSVDVYVKNPIDCPDEPESECPLIFLSQADLEKLIGDSSPLQRYKAFAVLQIE